MDELNNYGETSTLIRNFFGEAWLNGPYEDIKISWPNSRIEADTSEYWLQFVINDGDAFRATIGPSPIRRYLGFISIQIFAPIREGDTQLRRMADFISDIFYSIQTSAIIF